MMTQSEPKRPSRRRFLTGLLLSLPMLSFFRGVRVTETADDLVEVDGWILKRSDLS